MMFRSGECLYDNPTVPAGAPQVWQRGTDGIDRLAPLSSEMVPGKADSPCFTTVEQSADDTFGKAVIAQKDADTGKTCLTQVPVEDTDTAFLAGYRAEDVCSGTPDLRPVRIIPSDAGGCPDNIRLLAAKDVTEEVQPGLNRIRTVWQWLKSLVFNTVNVPEYAGDGDEGDSCLQPAAWVNDGDCVTLGRLAVEAGVMGQWALCGGCLKFFELPKDGDGDYLENMTLAYVGGDECWEWRLNGYEDGHQVIFAVSSAFPKTVFTLNDVPPGATFAHIAIDNQAVVNGPGSYSDQDLSAYFHKDQSLKVRVNRLFSDKGGDSGMADVALIPIVNGTVAFSLAVTTAGSVSTGVSGTVVGFS